MNEYPNDTDFYGLEKMREDAANSTEQEISIKTIGWNSLVADGGDVAGSACVFCVSLPPLLRERYIDGEGEIQEELAKQIVVMSGYDYSRVTQQGIEVEIYLYGRSDEEIISSLKEVFSKIS